MGYGDLNFNRGDIHKLQAELEMSNVNIVDSNKPEDYTYVKSNGYKSYLDYYFLKSCDHKDFLLRNDLIFSDHFPIELKVKPRSGLIVKKFESINFNWVKKFHLPQKEELRKILCNPHCFIKE